ncbi:hypothetical protein L3X39_11105 [Sabulilitoribacter multivorans]|uniref:Glycine dehydrogenase n=1 Tax=Flaviramulus multivorans TaxID=1304750 RepID=A0ABS9IKP7_9FLAO|nr:hypothetical protein [Flaviramulus multivorans]MCF7561186.1 hypothetical protein [Flaviramulus multivorans]
MSKVKIIMSCDEANHTCDKTQYKEASFWEKVKLNIHLIYCRACRDYTKNNTKLTKKIKVSKIECLDKQCKEKMKRDFEKVLEDQKF